MAVHTNGHGAQELREKPLTQLVGRLAEEASTLVRKEVELAKAELEVAKNEATQKGKEAGVGVSMFGAAALFGLLALGTLTACLVLALDNVMPAWAAALLLTVVYAAVAGGLVLTGKQRLSRMNPPSVMPEQTVETVKEDVAWAKTQLKSAKK